MPFKDSLSKIGKSISEGAASAAKKSGNLVEITKLNMTISGDEDKIKALYTELGEALQNKHERGEEVIEELLPICNRIDEIKANIEELRKKIVELKEVVLCPGCGVELPQETLFCPKCGTKQLPPKQKEEEKAVENCCPACKKEVEPGTVFCPYCGNKI